MFKYSWVGVEVGAWCEDWENLGAIKYIINQQIGCGYLLMKNEAFKTNSREDTKGGKVEVWAGGKGGGGGYSRTI